MIEMIEHLEKQIGFVYDRLSCDGNCFSGKINLGILGGAQHHLALGCILLREAWKESEEDKSSLDDKIKRCYGRMADHNNLEDEE